ncbi:MAG: hypothetical protein AUK06_00595 [Parcubacteria group bacterium CG2_30_36_18]|uniref:DUF11 domain-containing protein n=1 Tax=Candidatus Nealsonbacteria bacterium CG_4_10_14_3_um_filter_36_16 TaxID=1974685 RepID=A0A2M7MFN5_9BACT|nr:MAG: hypothetical protein AUK06_00595 [Parcubacteria group bacterium CG2_30_36_18]PIX88699.1 MAG: hypothetical protein COZ30_00130 [Candidatus Nealsonbacteria bacterium CG_4_10_14_3_um_filter_36_16]
MRKKFIIFLILLAGIAGLVGFWNWKSNSYSKEILKLEILGPESIDLTEEFNYVVKYKNNGNIRLEEPKLIFEYPEHSLLEEGKSLRQEIGAEELGDAIYPGEEKTISFKARLIGKEGETLIARAELTYRPKNLKARYESSTTFTTVIKSVPLTFEFDLPSKIESGKDLKFRLNYFSNTDYPLLNLKMTAEYPSGFEFVESNPPSLEKVEWKLPPLNRAEGGRIEISGKIRGEVREQKLFKAKLGIWQEGEFILLKEITKGVEIIQPALWVFQQINGSPKYLVDPEDQLHYEIFFKNVGAETLFNLSLMTTLIGDIFDFQTLKAPEGDFTLGDNSIVWDWKRVRALQFIEPGEEGKVEFWIKLKKDWEIPSLEGKTEIKNQVYLSQVKEEFSNKVNSKLEISQKGFFQDEIFGNSGPIPPKVSEATTYTIIWLAKNYYNEVKNVKVKAFLPQNVKLTGKIFPEEAIEKFTFDSQSREIVWNVGDLKVGNGVLNPAPNISFQVEFTPDETQRRSTPDLISEAKISGEDSWTGEDIEAINPSINTTLPDDETITEEMGRVQ